MMKTMMLKVTVGLLCVILAVSANTHVKKSKRQKKTAKDDMDEMFKGGGGDKTTTLATSRAEEVFNDDGDTLRNEFDDVITENEKTELKQLRNLRCPDGTKVFNLSRVALKEAIDAARDLAAQLTNDSDTTESSETSADNPLGQIARSLNRPRPASKAARCLRLACWNGTKDALAREVENISPEDFKCVFHPKLTPFLTDDVADRLADKLPEETVEQQLCVKLKRATTSAVIAVTKKFPCKELAKNNTAVAEALWQKQLERGVEGFDKAEWRKMLKDYGKGAPREALKKAPSDVIKERFADLINEKNMDILLDKIDFSTVDADVLQPLGDEICSLPASAFSQIPTDVMNKAEVKRAMNKCLKEMEDKTKKRMITKKMLATRDATTCKEYLENMDVADVKCWKELTATELGAFDFNVEGLDKLPCGIVERVKNLLQLGRVSTWSNAQVKTHMWMLCCLDLNDADETKVAQVLATASGDDNQSERGCLPPSLKRKLFKKMKQVLVPNAEDKLDVPKTKKLLSVFTSLTSNDIKQLITPAVMDSVLPTIQEESSKLKKPARRSIINMLSKSQLGGLLCRLTELAGDVPAETLSEMTSLWDILTAEADCTFQGQHREQFAVLFEKMKVEVPRLEDASAENLEQAGHTRAICGMTLDDVTNLQPVTTFTDVTATAFKAGCLSPAMNELFSDKLTLYMMYVEESQMSVTDVERLGPNFFKNMDPDDLTSYDSETKRSILQAIGRASDLDDVDPDRIKAFAVAAVAIDVVGDGDIDAVTILFLGHLMCGLDVGHVRRMTAAAMEDGMPKLNKCPDVSAEVLRAALQTMMSKMNLQYDTMDSADVVLGGVALLSDYDNVGRIPEEAKEDAFGDLAEGVRERRQNQKQRNEKWRDPTPDRKQTQEETQTNTRRGLKKMAEARLQAREGNAAQARRRRRSTGTFTCDDIRLLGEEAVILSEQDIAALSNNDFNNCADTLGSIAEWSQTQKEALADKGKQVWGNVNTWSGSDVVTTAGTILQGLTSQELGSMGLTLQDLETLGQHSNWTNEQLTSVFSSWLNSVNGGVSSITNTHLTQLGNFVCGATPTQIAGISSEAYSGAASDVGDAEECTAEQLQAWAALAIQALGPVTSWGMAQTAAVDRMLAGLGSSDLSQLTPSQLSVFDLETWASIPPDVAGSLTVEQLKSLSNQHALSFTEQQLSYMNGPQLAALSDLGVSFVQDNSAANGLKGTGEILVIFMTVIMILIHG